MASGWKIKTRKKERKVKFYNLWKYYQMTREKLSEERVKINLCLSVPCRHVGVEV
jgi:hypothetical protein